MKPFKTHRGIVVAIDKANIDTDAIMPKQFLKLISRTGFEKHLFHDWRYLPDGSANPDFELNKHYTEDATILVARNNFGCGSSREHAVWAIEQYGFRAIIAPRVQHEDSVIPGFADIFRHNCLKNGILTIELNEKEVDELFQYAYQKEKFEIQIDLEKQTVMPLVCKETTYHFEIDPAIKHRLLQGLDDIGITLGHDKEIKAFEAKHNVQMP